MDSGENDGENQKAIRDILGVLNDNSIVSLCFRCVLLRGGAIHVDVWIIFDFLKWSWGSSSLPMAAR